MFWSLKGQLAYPNRYIILLREVVIANALDEDPPCSGEDLPFSGRGVIQDTTYLMSRMDKIY